MIHYRPFSGKLPTISEYSKEIFFLKSAFNDVRNSAPQGCSVREKGTLFKGIFGILKILEHPFVSEHSQNVSVVQSGSRL